MVIDYCATQKHRATKPRFQHGARPKNTRRNMVVNYQITSTSIGIEDRRFKDFVFVACSCSGVVASTAHSTHHTSELILLCES